MKLTIVPIALATLLICAAPAAHADNPSFTLTLQNHKFDPAELEVPANVKVYLTVKNLDPTAEEFDSDDLHREKVVTGGHEAVVIIGPLKPGTYRFMGEYHSATAQGRIIAK
jgi:Cupredoxin-like domain